MKRILSLFLSCVFVIGIAFSTPIIASAEEAPAIEIGQVGYVYKPADDCFTYRITADVDSGSAECEVYAIDNTTEIAEIGESVLIDNVEYAITEIHEDVFNENTTLKKITIGSNIKVIPNAGSSIETICYKTANELISFTGMNAIYTGEVQGIVVGEESLVPSFTYDNKATQDKEKLEVVSEVGSYTVTVKLDDTEILTLDFSVDYFPCETHVWKNGVCDVCKIVCVHTWEAGKCKVCDLACVHTWEAGKCKVCELACVHTWEAGKCKVCEFACEHTWEAGKCKVCDLACVHTWEAGKCKVCDLACVHTWEAGKCKVCDLACVHTWEAGKCKVCDLACVHTWEAGKCKVCDLACVHTWEAGKCKVCDLACVHTWEAGKCKVCDLACVHTWEAGKCKVCDLACVHTWEAGKCKVCDLACVHTWEAGKCKVCDLACVHTWEAGKCKVCELTCEHTWEAGKCKVCELTCEHTWTDGKCDVCKTVCKHATWKDGKCDVCKIECEHTGGTATCYAKAVCENCGASYGEMKPHTIGTKIEKYPNCLVEGESKKYCKNEGCKYFVIESIEVDPDKHDWENGTRETTTKPTCKTEGVCTITCANGCGKTTTEAIPVVADAHVLSEWVESPATCVKEGKKTRVCMEEGCDYKETEVVAINKDAHDMTGEWEIVKKVTCVTDGEKELKCKNEGCTHKVTETVKADGTSHDLTGWQITVEPKCTVEGELAKLCKNEGCTYKETSSLDIVVDNHDPAEEFTVVPATCISAGEKYKVCKNPDCTAKLELEELPIDPEAHVNTEVLNAKEPTCLETGYTGDTFCKDCEKIIVIGVTADAKGHTASEWIVDKEATFEEDGAQHKECTVCKEELQKAVIEKRSLDTPVVKIENDGKGVKVTWSQDEDAAGYTVYRSTYNAKTKKWSKWVNRGTADASKTSWVDKKVENGVTYKYTVRAVNDKYKSAYKETSSLLYIVAPKVTCSITSTGILVNWNKIDNADSYDVYRSVLVDGVWVKWAKIGTTKAAKNTFLDDKVESGVNYKYTVRVVDGKVKSGYVSSASIIYLSQPVLKISNSANGVTGSWAKVEGATGYTIYRSEYNTSTKKWTKWLNLGTTKETAKSFTDKTVKSGYKYKYTIRAINGELKSTYVDSNQLIFLAQPTLTIANTAAGIQGKWDKVDGATGYILYRSELKEDGSWTKWLTLGTAKATAKSFTDKTVKSGVTYKYTIRAKNGNYKSSYVDSNSSIFLSIPTVKIANSETGVKVSWGKIDGATNYLVYRCELKNGKWTKWKELETVDTTSFVDETAVSNVKYKYTVRALNGDFRSYYTSSTELLYLAAPTVTADKIDEGIKVSWNKIDGATSYIIYRSELIEDGKWSKWTKLGTAGEKYTSCKDKTVKEDVVYKYTVRAVNGKLMSYYVASEQILNGVVTESTPEEPKTDVVA